MFPIQISDRITITVSIVILVTVSMATVFGITSAFPNTTDYSHKSGADGLHDYRYIQDSRANMSVRASQTERSEDNNQNSISHTLTETASKTIPSRIIQNTTNRTGGIVEKTTHLTATIIETTDNAPNTTNETTSQHLIDRPGVVTEKLNDTVERLIESDNATDRQMDPDRLGDRNFTDRFERMIDHTKGNNRSMRRWIESRISNEASPLPNETGASPSNSTPLLSNKTGAPLSNNTSLLPNKTGASPSSNPSHTPDSGRIVDSSNDSVSAPIDEGARAIDEIADTDSTQTTEEEQESSSASTPTATSSDREHGQTTQTTAEDTYTTNTERPSSATDSSPTDNTTDARIQPYPDSNKSHADSSEPINASNSTGDTDKIAEGGSEDEQHQNVSLLEEPTIPHTPESTPETGVAVGATAVAIRTLIRQGSIVPGTVSSTISVSNTGLLPTIRTSLDTHVTDPLSRTLALFRYSRHDDSDPLDHDGRARVFKTIEETPGVYLSAVSQQTDLSLSTIRHHLRVLEREDLVMSAKVHGKRRFYPTNSEQLELTAVLDDEATANVIEALCRLGPTSVSNLADDLDRDPSTVTHHLQRLNDDGIVHRERDGRTVINYVSPRVRALLSDSNVDGADQFVCEAD